MFPGSVQSFTGRDAEMQVHLDRGSFEKVKQTPYAP